MDKIQEIVDAIEERRVEVLEEYQKEKLKFGKEICAAEVAGYTIALNIILRLAPHVKLGGGR